MVNDIGCLSDVMKEKLILSCKHKQKSTLCDAIAQRWQKVKSYAIRINDWQVHTELFPTLLSHFLQVVFSTQPNSDPVRQSTFFAGCTFINHLDDRSRLNTVEGPSWVIVLECECLRCSTVGTVLDEWRAIWGFFVWPLIQNEFSVERIF